jgi:hypothetical protein
MFLSGKKISEHIYKDKKRTKNMRVTDASNDNQL